MWVSKLGVWVRPGINKAQKTGELVGSRHHNRAHEGNAHLATSQMMCRWCPKGFAHSKRRTPTLRACRCHARADEYRKKRRKKCTRGGTLLRLCLPPHLQMTNPILSASLRVLWSISFHLLSSPCLSGPSSPSPVLSDFLILPFIPPSSVFTLYLRVLLLFSSESTPFQLLHQLLAFFFLHSSSPSLPVPAHLTVCLMPQQLYPAWSLVFYINSSVPM